MNPFLSLPLNIVYNAQKSTFDLFSYPGISLHRSVAESGPVLTHLLCAAAFELCCSTSTPPLRWLPCRLEGGVGVPLPPPRESPLICKLAYTALCLCGVTASSLMICDKPASLAARCECSGVESEAWRRPDWRIIWEGVACGGGARAERCDDWWEEFEDEGEGVWRWLRLRDCSSSKTESSSEEESDWFRSRSHEIPILWLVDK